MGRADWVISMGIILLVVAGAIFYVPSTDEVNDDINQGVEESSVYSPQIHVDKLHWEDMPITYSYSTGCVGPIVPRIEQAISIIENETDELITFKEVDGDADIIFVCYEEQNIYANVYYDTTDYQLGLTTTEFIGDEITDATIEFWSVSETTRPDSCWNFPSLEAHEIIHAFGIGHIIYDPYSIMNPYGRDCIARDTTVTRNGKTFKPEDKIDDDIISCLDYIYSNGQQGFCSSSITFIDDSGY